MSAYDEKSKQSIRHFSYGNESCSIILTHITIQIYHLRLGLYLRHKPMCGRSLVKPEHDFKSAPKKSWQTVQRLMRGTLNSVHLQCRRGVADLNWVYSWAVEGILRRSPQSRQHAFQVWLSPFSTMETRGCVPTTRGSHSSASLGRCIPRYWRVSWELVAC